MKTQIVIIDIERGCAEVICKPLGVRLIVRDFDVQEETDKQDKDGRYYSQEEYGAKVSVP